MSSNEERISKAQTPGRLAMKLHPFYQGKIEVSSKCPVRTYDDFSIWYTPGVAEPCRYIRSNPEAVFDYTNRGNTIAVVSDGTRVLGLGDIGPEAGLPVMEGKSLLFKYLGGVDAFPIVLATKDPEGIITACKWLEPSFGGINLEDIAKPKCFQILDRLRREMNIPVWHDDQQGTATVVTAGFVNALKLTGRSIGQTSVAMIGAGAANVAILRVLTSAGLDPKKVVMVDSKGILHQGREDLQEAEPYKWDICLRTNGEGRDGGMGEALRSSDACIATSRPGPDTIRKEWISRMADNSIVFVCANPVPEIWPWDAAEAGAKIVATGRSDFPNQLNNSLGFPGIFRGALDVRSRTITDEMCLSAAYELAKVAQDRGLREDFIIPSMDDWEVFSREAVAVGMKAIEQGIARLKLSEEELRQKAFNIIKRARDQTALLMKAGFIPEPPP